MAKSTVVSQLYDKMMSAYVNDWHDSINRPEGIRGRGRNKLRNYCKYKINYSVENYCELIMPPKHRAALSKFRCGVAPIRVETGRYENLALNDRLCPFCNTVESEIHVLFYCRLYNIIRMPLLEKANAINPLFQSMPDIDKLSYILANNMLSRLSAKTCNDILNTRMFYLCK